MSSDERAPALTHEQVRAVLVEMLRAASGRLYSTQRQDRAQLAWDAATVAHIKQKQLAAKRFVEAGDADTRAAALSADISALEDRALLSLIEYEIEVAPNSEGGWCLAWDPARLPPGKSKRLQAAVDARDNGWPTARDALRAAAAVLGGQDAPKPSADLTAMQEQFLRELDDFFYGPDDEAQEGKDGGER